jgi:hypothetical protein
VTGENLARAKMAEAEAQLGEVQAESRRRREVAAAKATEAILIAEREEELARMAKDLVAPQDAQRRSRHQYVAQSSGEARILDIAIAPMAEEGEVVVRGPAEEILRLRADDVVEAGAVAGASEDSESTSRG